MTLFQYVTILLGIAIISYAIGMNMSKMDKLNYEIKRLQKITKDYYIDLNMAHECDLTADSLDI